MFFWSIFFIAYYLMAPSTHGELEVHMILHSHDDVGWNKTPKEYYYGIDDN